MSLDTDEQRNAFEKGIIYGKMDVLQIEIKHVSEQLTSLTNGLGARVKELEAIMISHTLQINTALDGVNDWKNWKNWVFMAVLGSIVMAVMALVLIKK